MKASTPNPSTELGERINPWIAVAMLMLAFAAVSLVWVVERAEDRLAETIEVCIVGETMSNLDVGQPYDEARFRAEVVCREDR